MLMKSISTTIKSNSIVISTTLDKEKLNRLKSSDAKLDITIVAESPVSISDCGITTLKYKGKV